MFWPLLFGFYFKTIRSRSSRHCRFHIDTCPRFLSYWACSQKSDIRPQPMVGRAPLRTQVFSPFLYSPRLSCATVPPDWKIIHVLPNMSGVVAWLRREFRGASGVIRLAPNSVHQSHGILGAQENLGACGWWHSPKKVKKMGKQAEKVNKIRDVAKKGLKRSTKFSKFLENVNKVFQEAKNVRKYFSCAPSTAQSCANSTQRCAEFGASVWEGVRRNGWKFSMPAVPLLIPFQYMSPPLRSLLHSPYHPDVMDKRTFRRSRKSSPAGGRPSGPCQTHRRQIRARPSLPLPAEPGT